MKRVLSVLLAVLMLLSVAPVSAFAEGDVVWEHPIFVVGSREVAPGDIIDVPVSIENNPGIVSFIWQINYEDYAMELLKVTPLQYTSIVVSSMEDNPITFIWNEDTLKQDCFDGGEVLLLTFRIKEDAAAGEYPLSLYYDPANVFNSAFESVRFDVHNGWITVRSTECNHEYDNDCDSDCNLCGEWRDAQHDWVDVGSKPATCTNNGLRMLGCQSCGVMTRETIPAFGHAYDDDFDADCNYCGEKREVEGGCQHEYDYPCATECYLCGAIREVEHAWVLISATRPTCSSNGVYRYKCELCGEPYMEKIPATGKHAYDDDADPDCNNCGEKREVEECPHKYTVKVLMAATCENGGVKRYTCVMCGDSYEESIPALGHAYDNDADSDCNNCGEKREVEVHVHEWMEKDSQQPTCTTDGWTKLYCPGCGVMTRETIPAFGHAYDDDFDPDCNYCGEKREVEECPHKYTVKVLMAATCAKGGLKRYTCVMCGDSYEESTPPTGEHVYDDDADPDCNNCGEKRDVEVHVHEWMEKDSQQPTCTTDGWTRLYCPGCGVMTRETIPAFGHSYDNDCDASCNNCGETREIEGHSYQLLPQMLKPTCTEMGRYYYYCAGCDDRYTEDIPALGHTYDHRFDADCNVCGATRNVENAIVFGDVSADMVTHGDTFTLSVGIDDNPGLAGWVVKVDFDESALELLSYAAGDTFPTDKISYGPTRNPASALFADFTSPDVTTNGVLFTLTFRVKEDAPIGATVLHLYTNDPDNFSTGDFLAVPVFFMDTTVNIQEHIHTYDNACDPDCNECGAVRDNSGHIYTHLVTPATCTEAGAIHYVCILCSDSYTVETPALGHLYTTEEIAPTCTEDGYTRFTCTNCGDSYLGKMIPAVGHAYDNDTDPDCNHCGEVREVACCHAYKNPEAPVCVLCGEPLSLSDILTVYGVSDNAILTRGDEFTLSVKMKNNPGLIGWRVFVRFDESVLELMSQNRGDVFPASAVSFGSLKSPANAMYMDAIHPDVEGDGTLFTLTFRVKEDAAFGNALLDVYVADPLDFYDTAWGEFEVITLDSAVVVDNHVHAYDGVCDGECNVCGFVRPAAEHTYDHACDTVCNGCGLVRKVAPHPYAGVVTAPTCTEEGYTTYTCSVCGDSYVADVVPATGHNHQGALTTAPTCEGEGVMTYTCTACGDTYTESVVALGHAYDAVVTDPTCVLEGYTTHTCTRCGNSYVDTIVAALGHAPGAAADCLHPQTCTVCGVELNPALGHDYAAVITAPTCTTDGYTTHTCTRCGDNYVDGVIAALGHAYVGSVTAPTCLTDGYTTYTCAVCGDDYVDNVVAALGHSYDNACDATCNTCGEIREVGDHVYDHDYDATCNECGDVREIPYIPGDVDDNGTVNVRDLGRLQQYLNGFEVTINLAAANVDGNTTVNVRDLGRLQQYLNGYDVELK